MSVPSDFTLDRNIRFQRTLIFRNIFVCLNGARSAVRSMGKTRRIAIVTVAAIAGKLPEAAWQRCYVHFLRNALDHLPRKHGDDCLQELRWLYDRRDLDEAKTDLSAWLAKWSARYPRLTSWVEETIEQTLSFFRLPRQHHKHLKSTNMLERLNEEIRRRPYVVRIFPNTESCLRLVRALAVETHENWMEANRYINMDDLREHKKLALRQAA